MIFDFDGVVVDSEPIHLMAFQRVLAGVGVALSREDYYGRYLGFDDHDCFVAALADHGTGVAETKLKQMIAEKSRLVQDAFAHGIEPMPGAVELAAAAASAGIPVGVCSGALREEILLAARTVGLGDVFLEIVAAEDVRRGKPDPEGYRLARRRLAELSGRDVRPERCLVVEDAPAGIEAAKSLGMKVLAVTNSYAPGALKDADRIVRSLEGVTLESLEEIV
jgi:beta-phosphoglucomutase